VFTTSKEDKNIYKLLVVDDEEDLCSLIKVNLESTGRFKVVTTTNPLDAEKLCQAIEPDLIILDVVMPQRKGSFIAESLKRNPSTQNIPIIIMSGFGEMNYCAKQKKWKWLPNNPIAIAQSKDMPHDKIPRIAADTYGVDDYISKPFTTDELISVIRRNLPKS
jgi:CheY-like chemotaxis protein